jgi:predicted nucleic acid-binding protein
VRTKYRIAAADIERLRAFLESDLVAVALTAVVQGVATHPEDDVILATAASARADYLVTGDRQLQALGKFGSTRIVSPREFLDLLGIDA